MHALQHLIAAAYYIHCCFEMLTCAVRCIFWPDLSVTCMRQYTLPHNCWACSHKVCFCRQVLWPGHISLYPAGPASRTPDRYRLCRLLTPTTIRPSTTSSGRHPSQHLQQLPPLRPPSPLLAALSPPRLPLRQHRRPSSRSSGRTTLGRLSHQLK